MTFPINLENMEEIKRRREIAKLRKQHEHLDELRPVTYRDESGRKITEFVGPSKLAFAPFMQGGMVVTMVRPK